MSYVWPADEDRINELERIDDLARQCLKDARQECDTSCGRRSFDENGPCPECPLCEEWAPLIAHYERQE